MTANEFRLLKLLLICVFLAGLLPAAYLGFERKNNAERSIDSYIAAVEKMRKNDSDILVINRRINEIRAAIGNQKTLRTEGAFSDFAEDVRSLLAKNGIVPLRYQVIGTGDDAAIEFSLRCATVPFFRFLRETSEGDRLWTIPYIAIRPDESTENVNVSIRVKYVK